MLCWPSLESGQNDTGTPKMPAVVPAHPSTLKIFPWTPCEGPHGAAVGPQTQLTLDGPSGRGGCPGEGRRRSPPESRPVAGPQEEAAGRASDSENAMLAESGERSE